MEHRRGGDWAEGKHSIRGTGGGGRGQEGREGAGWGGGGHSTLLKQTPVWSGHPLPPPRWTARYVVPADFFISLLVVNCSTALGLTVICRCRLRREMGSKEGKVERRGEGRGERGRRERSPGTKYASKCRGIATTFYRWDLTLNKELSNIFLF